MSTQSDRTAALLATPSLEALSYALRHPETWPERFEWDYRSCRTCAVGLAFSLWKSIEFKITPLQTVCCAFGMMRSDARAIFMDLAGELYGDDWPKWERRAAAITPDHVADAIDAYLNARSKA